MDAPARTEGCDVKQFLEEIASAVRGFYTGSVDPLGEQFAFQRRQTEGEIKGPPIVLTGFKSLA